MKIKKLIIDFIAKLCIQFVNKYSKKISIVCVCSSINMNDYFKDMDDITDNIIKESLIKSTNTKMINELKEHIKYEFDKKDNIHSIIASISIIKEK